ncbi:MAG TPA: S1C family serine protease, partial [Acetobacteraceae bacterium]|nr:S1C family serine protease [Acetobacteraceae bacterium]
RIDALLRLDVRLGTDEGGPVLDSGGQLLGMSTAGPRRRALAIPAATIDRVLDPLLAEGRVARGWLGVGLQPVMVPETLRPAAGQDSGMMVMSLASGGPAAAAGVLPGDILLDLDGTPVRRMRALAAAMGPDQIGKSVALRLLRAGAVQTLAVTIAARPAA